MTFDWLPRADELSHSTGMAPAGCRRHPFFVRDTTGRFHRNVVQDFVAEYAAGPTSNACLRRRGKIEFAAELNRVLGRRLLCGPHRPLRANRGWSPDRAADPGKDQSYVLAALTAVYLCR